MSTQSTPLVITPNDLGPAADTSGMAADKTVVIKGLSQGKMIIEGSNDGGSTWCPVAEHSGGGSESFSFDAVAAMLRVDARQGVAASAECTAESSLCKFVSLTAPANGSGASQDVTDLGSMITAVAGVGAGSVALEISQDNASWGPATSFKSFSKNSCDTGDLPAKWARAVGTNYGGSGIHLGAVDDVFAAIGEASALALASSDFIYAPHKTAGDNVYANLDEIVPTHARQKLVASGNPSDGDTVTMDGQVYTFRDIFFTIGYENGTGPDFIVGETVNFTSPSFFPVTPGVGTVTAKTSGDGGVTGTITFLLVSGDPTGYRFPGARQITGVTSGNVADTSDAVSVGPTRGAIISDAAGVLLPGGTVATAPTAQDAMHNLVQAARETRNAREWSAWLGLGPGIGSFLYQVPSRSASLFVTETVDGVIASAREAGADAQAILVSTTSGVLAWEGPNLEGGTLGLISSIIEGNIVEVLFDPYDDDGNLGDNTGQVLFPVNSYNWENVLPMGMSIARDTEDPGYDWPGTTPARIVLKEGTVVLGQYIELGSLGMANDSVVSVPFEMARSVGIGNKGYANVYNASLTAPMVRAGAEPIDDTFYGFNGLIIDYIEGRARQIRTPGNGNSGIFPLFDQSAYLGVLSIFARDGHHSLGANMFRCSHTVFVYDYRDNATGDHPTSGYLWDGGVGDNFIEVVGWDQRGNVASGMSRYNMVTALSQNGATPAFVNPSPPFNYPITNDRSNLSLSGGNPHLGFATNGGDIQQMLPPIGAIKYLQCDATGGKPYAFKKHTGEGQLSVKPGVSLLFKDRTGGPPRARWTHGVLTIVTFSGGGVGGVYFRTNALSILAGEMYIDLISGPVPVDGETITWDTGAAVVDGVPRVQTLEGSTDAMVVQDAMTVIGDGVSNWSILNDKSDFGTPNRIVYRQNAAGALAPGVHATWAAVYADILDRRAKGLGHIIVEGDASLSGVVEAKFDLPVVEIPSSQGEGGAIWDVTDCSLVATANGSGGFKALEGCGFGSTLTQIGGYEGSSSTIFEFDGDHSESYDMAYDGGGGTPFVLNDELTFSGGGVGRLMTHAGDGATGTLKFRMLSGAVPANDETFTADKSTGNAVVNGALVAVGLNIAAPVIISSGLILAEGANIHSAPGASPGFAGAGGIVPILAQGNGFPEIGEDGFPPTIDTSGCFALLFALSGVLNLFSESCDGTGFLLLNPNNVVGMVGEGWDPANQLATMLAHTTPKGAASINKIIHTGSIFNKKPQYKGKALSYGEFVIVDTHVSLVNYDGGNGTPMAPGETLTFAAGTGTVVETTGDGTTGTVLFRLASGIAPINDGAISSDGGFAGLADGTPAFDGAFTLPSGRGLGGTRCGIKDVTGNAAANNISLNAAGSDTVDGAAGETISTDRGVVEVMCTQLPDWSTVSKF